MARLGIEGIVMVSETSFESLGKYGHHSLFQSDKLLNLYHSLEYRFKSLFAEHIASLFTTLTAVASFKTSFPLANVKKLLPHPSLILAKNNFENLH